jgi:hypothetical protein
MYGVLWTNCGGLTDGEQHYVQFCGAVLGGRDREDGGTGGQGNMGTGGQEGRRDRRTAHTYLPSTCCSQLTCCHESQKQYSFRTRIEPKSIKSAGKYSNSDINSVALLREIGLPMNWLFMQLLYSIMYRTVPNWLLCKIQLLNSTMCRTVPNWGYMEITVVCLVHLGCLELLTVGALV